MVYCVVLKVVCSSWGDPVQAVRFGMVEINSLSDCVDRTSASLWKGNTRTCESTSSTLEPLWARPMGTPTPTLTSTSSRKCELLDVNTSHMHAYMYAFTRVHTHTLSLSLMLLKEMWVIWRQHSSSHTHFLKKPWIWLGYNALFLVCVLVIKQPVSPRTWWGFLCTAVFLHIFKFWHSLPQFKWRKYSMSWVPNNPRL